MRSCVQLFDLYGIYTSCTWVVLGMMISPPRDLMSSLPLAIPFVVSHQSLVVIAVVNIRSFTEGSVITVKKEERGEKHPLGEAGVDRLFVGCDAPKPHLLLPIHHVVATVSLVSFWWRMSG